MGLDEVNGGSSKSSNKTIEGIQCFLPASTDNTNAIELSAVINPGSIRYVNNKACYQWSASIGYFVDDNGKKIDHPTGRTIKYIGGPEPGVGTISVGFTTADDLSGAHLDRSIGGTRTFHPYETYTVTVLQPTIVGPTSPLLINHDSMEIADGSQCEAKFYDGGANITGLLDFEAEWEFNSTWQASSSTYYSPGPTANDKITLSGNPCTITGFDTGGDLHIVLKGKMCGMEIVPVSKNDVDILIDEDPSNGDFAAELGSDIMCALAWQEGCGWSVNYNYKYNHYESNIPGTTPRVNSAGCWGIMNISKHWWESFFDIGWNEIAWNWKTNIECGKNIYNHYYGLQTTEQKGWPETSSDINVPNRQDLTCYGYSRGNGPMSTVTTSNWHDRVAGEPDIINIHEYLIDKPWNN